MNIKNNLILLPSGNSLIETETLFVHPLPKDKGKLNLRRKRILTKQPLNWYINLSKEDKDTVNWLINRKK